VPYLSEDKIASIVERVVGRLNAGDTRGSSHAVPSAQKPRASEVATPRWNPPPALRGSMVGRGVFTDLDVAIDSAREAFVRFCELGLERRYAIVAEIRREAHKHVEILAKMAVEETGLGRVDQKIIKNRLVIDKTPGPEVLTSFAQTGDNGLTLEEYAPYGVIGAITPTTNPSETILCNGIGMVAASNAVVFNAHPSAKKTSAYTVQFMNEAIVRAGGPENLIACVAEPTIETAQKLMRHPGTRIIVVTGGPGVVKEAMMSGKKVIAGGPGNPPVVVDETADLEQAAEGIVRGVSLDNNIVCCAEKEIIAVSAIADPLKKLLVKHGAYALSPEECAKVEKVILDGDHPRKQWVGKDALLILREAGIQAPANTLIAFAEVPEKHPFVQIEMLLPVTGLVRVGDVREAIQTAVRCEHGCCHTAVMYSKNIENLHNMACAVNTTIFVKNAPSFAGLGLGGEGCTSFTIASPTGEGMTNARHFSRVRRCTLKDYFRIV